LTRAANSEPVASVAEETRFNWGQAIARMGPGLAYVLTVLGTGDMVANSATGAGYGYALIWILAPGLVFRFVWVNVSAKYILVTGESLIEGYARVGQWILWLILISLIVLMHLYNMYALVMSGSAVNMLLPLPAEWSAKIWSLFFTLLAFVMAYWGGYEVLELFCKILIGIMGASLVVVAFLSKPDPAEILQGIFIPSIPADQGSYSVMFLVMALVGTVAGSVVINITYAYFLHEKGWRDLSHLRQQRFDLVFGVVCLFLMAGLLQIAAGATIHPLGIDLKDENDLVRVFSEVQGVVGLIIFSLGLWGASFSTMVGTTVGCALIVADLSRFLTNKPWASKHGRKEARRRPVYRACVIFWCFSPLYVLYTEVSPVWLVLVVSALAAALIPVLTPALIKITSDENLMGEYKNGWFTNAILGLMVLVAVYFGYRNMVEIWSEYF
jgi:Mn2+/Fe2+ NRAMP family transporter